MPEAGSQSQLGSRRSEIGGLCHSAPLRHCARMDWMVGDRFCPSRISSQPEMNCKYCSTEMQTHLDKPAPSLLFRVQMGSIRKVTAFLLLALWLPVTQHCGLDAAGLVSATHVEQHASSCGELCVCDGCATIEDGAYRPSDTYVKVPPLSVCACIFCLQIASLASDDSPALPTGSFDRPPDWVTTWHIVRRAAPPSRAPTLLIA
jgi:hypothetical protein